MRIALPLTLLLCACTRQGPPYSPGEALKSFQLPPGFRMELVAAEPQVVDPVAMAFDAQGRLFVVEMPDYPMGERAGRVKLLRDGDGDGRFERSTVFADHLRFPNGVLPWKGGILVTAAPDIVYLQDTNGDDRADTRRVVLTGFAATNPQLRLNGLRYGLDNWIYAAYPKVGRPDRYRKEFGDLGSPIRFPDRPGLTPVDVFGKGMDLRFRPEEGRLEPVAGNSQFGNTFDRWGNRFTVWHNNHVRHVVIQAHYLLRNPYLAVESAMEFLSDHGNAATLYPITKDPLHIHESEIGHFTSSCGISVYEGGAFPSEYAGTLFVCDPVHNVIHRDVLDRRGATFVARRGHEASEFLASSDSWFRPVFTTLGPDGALYVVDFYRKIVEHPEWMPLEMMDRADFSAGSDRGRIYRIVHESGGPWLIPRLQRAGTAELVGALTHQSLWWRLMAQQLLVERQDRTAAPELRRLALQGDAAETRLHALWTLDGLETLDVETLRQALSDRNPGVRENAIRLAEKRLDDRAVVDRLLALVDDPSSRVQFQLACTLGELVASARYSPDRKSGAVSRNLSQQSFGLLQRIALRNLDDSWFQIAVLSSAGENALEWFRTVAARADLQQTPADARKQFLLRIASILGARERSEEVAAVLATVARSRSGASAWWRVPSLEGMARGLGEKGANRLKLSTPAEAALLRLLQERQVRRSALLVAERVELRQSETLLSLVQRASEGAMNPGLALEERADLLNILGLDSSGRTIPALEKFLAPQQPEQLQLAAARALLYQRTPKASTLLMDRWKICTARIREMVLQKMLGDRDRISFFLDAVQGGKVQPWSVSAGQRARLLNFPDQAISKRAAALFGDFSDANRKAVIEKYWPAVRMKGSVEKGKQVFRDSCGKCHRVGNEGFEVGPDLKSLSTRGKEDLLRQILDPNAYVAAGYEEYAVETTGGGMVTGIVARETATSVTLRRSLGEEDTILRNRIATLRMLNVSQMPEDLEKNLTLQDMADLLQYLKSLGYRR